MGQHRSSKTTPEEAMTMIARRATQLTASYREARSVVVDVLASFAGTC
ncbi:hypothetical protein PAMC26510_35065 [Caballeronia sordidicola]|uniref:Uncharacterized protein n=1 Tax=Caballeronia sordidicola TaxID=196367 RepID=A0A242M632_CABSO|nr:hypothetical protein PAMC26510_35065 [Caballeronia sordidicola]